MSKKEIGNVPKLAQELFDHLPKEFNDELKELVARAENGQDTTFEIVELFSKHEYTRKWLKENVGRPGQERSETKSSYGSLPGHQAWIPPTLKWVCPESPDKHWMMVMQADEEVPLCPMCEKDKKKSVMRLNDQQEG
jgi:hypothetical protein